MEEKQLSTVSVSYKKSSSKDGNEGWDITVNAVDGITQKDLDELGSVAVNTAKKLRTVI